MAQPKGSFTCNRAFFKLQATQSYHFRGLLLLLKFYWAPDIVEFVLGRFSHFNIAIAYSNSTFCGAWTPSFCEFTQNFSKTSTPLATTSFLLLLLLYLLQSLGCARFAEILSEFRVHSLHQNHLLWWKPAPAGSHWSLISCLILMMSFSWSYKRADPFESACIDAQNFDPAKCTDASSQVRSSVNHLKAVIRDYK